MKKLMGFQINGPQSAQRALADNTQRMLDAGLCPEFTTVVGMAVGSIVSKLGKDDADLFFSEMVAATALLQTTVDDDGSDDGGGDYEPTPDPMPIGGAER